LLQLSQLVLLVKQLKLVDQRVIELVIPVELCMMLIWLLELLLLLQQIGQIAHSIIRRKIGM